MSSIIPEDIQKQLDEIDQELADGDITEKGWQKKRMALLNKVPSMHKMTPSIQDLSSTQLKAIESQNSLACSQKEAQTEKKGGGTGDSDSKGGGADKQSVASSEDGEVGHVEDQAAELSPTAMKAFIGASANSNTLRGKKANEMKRISTFWKATNQETSPSDETVEDLLKAGKEQHRQKQLASSSNVRRNKSVEQRPVSIIASPLSASDKGGGLGSLLAASENVGDLKHSNTNLNEPADGKAETAHDNLLTAGDEVERLTGGVGSKGTAAATKVQAKDAKDKEKHEQRFGTIGRRLNAVIQSNRQSVLNLKKSKPIAKSSSAIQIIAEDSSPLVTAASVPLIIASRPEPETSTWDEALKFDLADFDTVVGVVRERSEKSPKHIALTMVDPKGRETAITYEKLSGRAEKVAMALKDKIPQNLRNQPVNLLYRQSEAIDFLVAFLGCLFAGLTCVPIPSATFHNIAQCLKKSEGKLVLTTDSFSKALNKELTKTKTESLPADLHWLSTEDFGVYSTKKKGPFQVQHVPADHCFYYDLVKNTVGALTAVGVKKATIFHSAKMMRSLYGMTSKDIFYTSLDIRTNFGLLNIAISALYVGATLIFSPYETDMLTMFHHLKKYQPTMVFSNEPQLALMVGKLKDLNAEQMKKLIKTESQSMTSVRYLFSVTMAASPRPNAYLLNDASRLLLNVGLTMKSAVIPITALSEMGGLILACRSAEDKNLLEGLELGVSASDLQQNIVNVLHSGSSLENPLVNLSRGIIRVCDSGLVLPETEVAVVDPRTSKLVRPDAVGEIWISSALEDSHLPSKFLLDDHMTEELFHQTLLDEYGNEIGGTAGKFIKTRQFGFFHQQNGRLYVLGMFGERLGDVSPPSGLQTSVHYTFDLNRTVTEMFTQVEECRSFGITLSDEELAIMAVSLKSVPSGASELQNICRFISETALSEHQLRLYSILLCPTGSLPHDPDGRLSLERCRRYFDLGLLNPVYVSMNVSQSSRRVLGVRRVEGEGEKINALASHLAKALSTTDDSTNKLQICDGNDVGNIGFGFGAVDQATNQDLLAFGSITALLKWRSITNKDQPAYVTVDQRCREQKVVTFRKLDEKVNRIAAQMIKKGLKAGDVALIFLPQGLEFSLALHACFYLGVAALVFPEIRGELPEFELLALMKLVKQYRPHAILTVMEGEEVLKHRRNELKSLIYISDMVINVHKAPKQGKSSLMSEDVIQNSMKFYAEKTNDSGFDLSPLMTVVLQDDRVSICRISYETLIAQCVMLKEFFNLKDRKPLISCGRHTSGLGLLNGSIFGIFCGSSTYILSNLDFLNSPHLLLDAMSKFQCKDIFTSFQMLEYTIAHMNDPHHNSHHHHGDQQQIYLNHLNNWLVFSDTRTPQATATHQLYLANFKIDHDALCPAYAPLHHPLASSRSYLQQASQQLWISVEEMRRQKVKVVEPNSIGSLCICDSGRVAPCTTVVICRLGTNEPVNEGEIGEIWVSSPASMDAISYMLLNDASSVDGDQLKQENFEQELDCTFVSDQERRQHLNRSVFVNTGDIGFLRPSKVISYRNGKADSEDSHLLYVLGRHADLIEIEGYDRGFNRRFIYFPLDLETSIEQSHPCIIPHATIVFNSPESGGLVAIVEISEPDANALNCIPVIVNAVLDAHQVALARIAFVSERNRLGSDHHNGGSLWGQYSKINFRFRSIVKKEFQNGTLNLHSLHFIQ